VSDDHSSLDELADLDEGLLQPSRADEVRAHLAGCAACRDRHQSLRDVHDELAVLPPETMPPGVVEKLDRALADAAPRSATIVPLAPVSQQRRRGQRGWPAMAGVAAGIVLIGFVAAVVVGALGHGGSSDGGSTTAGSAASRTGGLAPLSTRHFTKSVSSKTFNHTSVIAEVRRLVSGPPTGATANLSPTSSGNSQANTRVPALVPQALHPLYSSPSALLHCAATLADQKDAVPIAVEFTRYTTTSVRHAPSVLFVFSVDPTHVEVIVASPDCTGQEPIRDVLNVPIG
jgi:anti-sigma factor RsiW